MRTTTALRAVCFTFAASAVNALEPIAKAVVRFNDLTFNHVSCWQGAGVAPLGGEPFASPDMTVEACATHCQDYPFFGLTAGRLCKLSIYV